MNIDQCKAIISEVFEQAWPQIAPGGSKPWSEYFIREVVYPIVRCFPESVARESAHELVRVRNFPPPMVEWAKVAGGMYATESRDVRTDCPECSGRGYVSVSVPCDPHARKIEWDKMRHSSDPSTRAPGWYTFAVACGCPNTPPNAANREQSGAAAKVVSAFERTLKGSDWQAARPIIMGLRDTTTLETRRGTVAPIAETIPQRQAVTISPDDDIPF